MQNKKKRIVVIGAGFAGLRIALDLSREIHQLPEYEILLIDKNEAHLYTPDLYEIATAYYPVITSTCLTNLKETVATKIPSLISEKPITFLQDTVTKISLDVKTVSLEKNGEVSYEYLAVALGSVANYYNIPGLQQFSYPLKTISDALAIQCHLDSYFQTLWRSHIKKSVHIVVGGGGATGVELACELPSYLAKLCQKYGYPYENVDVTVVEGKKEVVGLGQELSNRILKRFEVLGVKTKLGTYITEALAGKVRIKGQNGMISEIPADMLIWSGGILPNPLGSLKVNEHLESIEYPDVFAAGDNALCGAPPLAYLAIEEGKIVAKNILAKIKNQSLISFRPQMRGVIIPGGGKYAIIKYGEKVFSGFWCWVIRKLTDLRYVLTIMPFPRALKKWWHATNIFVQND